MMIRLLANAAVILSTLIAVSPQMWAGDPIRDLQTKAISDGKSPVAHWGWEPDNYKLWGTHTNRLIPVYTFGTSGQGDGGDLTSYQGSSSPYRSPAAIRQLYGYLPAGTVNPDAEYFDQTNIYDLQLAGLRAGKKHIILVVFDGMDWQTTQAASIAKTGRVDYQTGRGNGLHFQNYQANGTSQFGQMVTSPFSDDFKLNVNDQKVNWNPAVQRGGYAAQLAGQTSWSTPVDAKYLIGKPTDDKFSQAYTDSASSATSMTAGIKTYNAAINVDAHGMPVHTIAHLAQSMGWKTGVVTSVLISHATPASAYAHNVSRNDYQDLSRDLLGLPSVSHPVTPLAGVDVLMGCGFGAERSQDRGQGDNFVPGNGVLTEEDLLKIGSRTGGNYVVAARTTDVSGAELLNVKADDAIESGKRLFGFFGTSYGHLPFQTANGDFAPTVGRKDTAETYTEADLLENPTLADFTEQALRVLSADGDPFWLMVEAGDVDWANHDNNLDNSIGAVLSGDAAVKQITDWVEANSNWDESLLIVTADHGHYLVIDRPELLIDRD